MFVANNTKVLTDSLDSFFVNHLTVKRAGPQEELTWFIEMCCHKNQNSHQFLAPDYNLYPVLGANKSLSHIFGRFLLNQNMRYEKFKLHRNGYIV
jgi:hypothetical protein